MENNQPEKKFTSGAVSATIWRNNGKRKSGEDVEFNSISLQRSYKDKDGKWQNTSSLRISDLPRVTLVVGEAYKYLALREHGDDAAEEIVM